MTATLVGRRVVVTRAEAQARPLVAEIVGRGGVVVELPLLEIADPVDGGRELRRALDELHRDDWLVVLSPNGARRVVDVVGPNVCRLAVVAGGTAAVFEDADWTVDLLPATPSSDGLLEAFETVDVGSRVLIAQAEGGRTVLADGLRERGERVEVVIAYRNRAPSIDMTKVDQARSGDTVVFASPSAVDRYVEVVGVVPTRAVCIGSVTASTARDAGFTVTTATEPTVDALVTAIEGA